MKDITSKGRDVYPLDGQTLLSCHQYQWQIQGRGPPPPPPLSFGQNEARRAEKKLSYLKVWIHHWISITSLCLCICRIARELNLSSVMVLCRGVCSLFIPQKLPSGLHRISQQSYERYIILRDRIVELAWSKVSTKVCGFKFGSIKLHLTSKRIKEILTQKRQYNWKQKWFQEIKKNLYTDFSCMHKHICVHARYIPGSRNSW